MLLHGNTAVTRGWLGGMLNCLEREPAAAIAGPMTNGGFGPQRVEDADYRNLGELEAFSGRFRSSNAGRRIRVDQVLDFCLIFSRSLRKIVGEK